MSKAAAFRTTASKALKRPYLSTQSELSRADRGRNNAQKSLLPTHPEIPPPLRFRRRLLGRVSGELLHSIVQPATGAWTQRIRCCAVAVYLRREPLTTAGIFTRRVSQIRWNFQFCQLGMTAKVFVRLFGVFCVALFETWRLFFFATGLSVNA